MRAEYGVLWRHTAGVLTYFVGGDREVKEDFLEAIIKLKPRGWVGVTGKEREKCSRKEERNTRESPATGESKRIRWLYRISSTLRHYSFLRCALILYTLKREKTLSVELWHKVLSFRVLILFERVY